MFTNIGSKIKMLAKIICWLGIIVSVLIGVLTMFSTADTSAVTVGGNTVSGVLPGILFIIVGALSSWVSSLTLYGFGELIQKTSENNECLKKIADK